MHKLCSHLTGHLTGKYSLQSPKHVVLKPVILSRHFMKKYNSNISLSNYLINIKILSTVVLGVCALM